VALTARLLLRELLESSLRPFAIFRRDVEVPKNIKSKSLKFLVSHTGKFGELKKPMILLRFCNFWENVNSPNIIDFPCPSVDPVSVVDACGHVISEHPEEHERK
jgi:hypothetical protein